jgi:tripartite-type tricarboxylate transporter receptor subunit TctC
MKRLALLLAVVVSCLAQNAWAQYPSKAIRLVVPFPPAGAADLTARVVAQPLSQALGQPVVLDYKAGADGAIAGLDVLRAAPDGYTLLFGTNTGMCAAPVLRKNPPYDPIADFTPVALVGKFGFFVFAHESVPAKTLEELIAHIRNNPGKLNYGTGNSTSILASAQLARLERLEVAHIPYKGDAGVSADLIAGRLQMVIATPGTLLSYVKEGKVRALATLLPTRSPLLPETPTLTELGKKGISIQPFAAIYGPPRMPREIVERVAREVQAVMAKPEVREGVARHAFEAQSSTTPELVDFHREQLEIWRRTVRELGIQPD